MRTDNSKRSFAKNRAERFVWDPRFLRRTVHQSFPTARCDAPRLSLQDESSSATQTRNAAVRLSLSARAAADVVPATPRARSLEARSTSLHALRAICLRHNR